MSGYKYDKAIQSIKAGLTIREVSQLYSIKYRTLCNYLFKKGIKPVQPNSRPISKKLKRLKSKRHEMLLEQTKVCMFCQHPEEREPELGKFHIKSKVSVHYYCLLFSCALEQNGEDDEGILGFLQKDILREIQRGRKLKCIYCQKVGATIGCHSKCRSSYHFPCGLDNNAQFVFTGDFRSYCCDHREYQKNIEIAKSDCPICLDPVKQDPKYSIYPPCCKKSWFHRLCLQKLALSAGYFFKCPLCNDKPIFVKDMLQMGVYVPEQDASWENEPNAFAELLERPIHCDAPKCTCAQGRNHDDEGTIWEVVLCSLCGSTGTHLKCGKLRLKDAMWECFQCVEMLRNSSKISSKSNTFSGSFYPRKKKTTSRQVTGESSGLTNPATSFSPFVQSEKNTLPSIENMHKFAHSFPAILHDLKLQQAFEEIVPNYQLKIFGDTIEQFCSSSLKEIQMLVLFQIYKPLSLWFDQKRSEYVNIEKPSCEEKLYLQQKMKNLAKLIQTRMAEANTSLIMDQFKISADLNEGKSSSEVIRYGNSFFSLNKMGKDRQRIHYTLLRIKDCYVLLKPLSRLEIEQKCNPTLASASNNCNNGSCIQSKIVKKLDRQINKTVRIYDVKENHKTMPLNCTEPAKACAIGPKTCGPLGERCLNTIKELFPPSKQLLPTKYPSKCSKPFKRSHKKSKDSKKYIQLSISDFFRKY